jgi:signal transduction histidine kinase
VRDGGVHGVVSDLSRPENRYERGQGDLLEVYMGVKGPAGQPLMFEAYERQSSITASGRRLWLAFAPALIGGLLLLQLIQLPLAGSLARRLRQGHREREGLLVKAVEASDAERRRIASVLHDSVVQNLAATAFSLEAAAARARREGRTDGTGALERGAGATRDSIGELRTLLVDLYPASLHHAGLEPSLRELLEPLERAGVETSVEIDPGLRLPVEQEVLLFRVAREALRNVGAHAQASHARVRVTRARDAARIAIEDDGRGFDPAHAPEGHFGLRLVRDLVRELGGSVEVESAPGAGTVVRAEVPAG